MSAQPVTISIGLPVFNGEDFLAASIESILAQEYEDFELIIADNGSTDATEKICRGFVDRDPRIRYERSSENHGAAWNYNRLVDDARGRYFKWASHDDLHEPSYLGDCVEALNASPDAVLVYPRTILIDKNDEELGRYDDQLDVRSPDPVQRLYTVVRRLDLCNPVFGVYRLDVLRQTGVIRPFSGSDKVLLAEIAILGQIHEIPDYLFLRRRHAMASRLANRDWKSVQAWFAPDRSWGAWIPPRLWLHVAHLRMIFNSGLTGLTLIRCVEGYLEASFRRWIRVRGGYYKSKIKGWLGMSPGQTDRLKS